MKQNWRFYQNYVIIAILSLISVFFLPMLGSSLGIGFNIPDTPAGWIVWSLTKCCIVVVNILIFDQFVKQAKVNVRDNEQFIKAEEILNGLKDGEEEEILPAKTYISKMYRKKGITLGITTVLSIFGLTNALLTFDWVSMLTYIFTIIMALVFGWITMNEVEDVWTDKHYKYALKIQRKNEEDKRMDKQNMEMVKDQSNKQGFNLGSINSGINILDTSICTSDFSNNHSESLVLDNYRLSNSILGGSINTGSHPSNSTNIIHKENIEKEKKC